MLSACPEKSVYRLSLSDRWLGEDLSLKISPEPEEAARRDLAADCFWTAFKPDPAWKEETPPERAVNRELLEWLTRQPSWSEARSYTETNIPASLLAAPALYGTLTQEEAIKEALQKQEEAEEKANRAKELEAEANLKRWLAVAAEAAGDEELFLAYANKVAALLEEAQKNRSEAASLAGQGVLRLKSWRKADEMRAQAIAAGAAKKAAETAQETAAVLSGWGFGPGVLSEMPVASMLKLLKQLQNKKLRQIAVLAGRLKQVALSARRSRVVSGLVPYGLGRVKEFKDALPEELAHLSPLAPPALRAKKAAEWATDGLPGIVRKGEAKEDGPFFVAVDVSGSMSGSREIFAKAVALALARIAGDEGRDYYLASFSSANDKMVIVTREQAKNDPASLMRWASATYGGGTSFDVPLAAAMDWIALREGADLVFISDGEAAPSPKTV
ncbi:MAG: VWA domain-containing protein, partial [Desulfotomaculales bacterium]